jgi:uncharacterized protein YbjT (DUF2867 family)
VTGATGKTGRRLIPLLLSRGANVRAASRAAVTPAPGAEAVRFDWADESTYETARKGVNAIYIVYGDPGVSGDNTEQVRALLDGAADAGVGRVVLLSALGVDRTPPDNPLRQIELVVEASGVPSTILRPGAFMQNFSERHRTRLLEGIRERSEIAMPGGNGTVSWLSTEDIAAVAAVALTRNGHEGKGYDLVGPEPLTMAQVARHISTAAGRPITYVETGQEEIRAIFLSSGMPPALAGAVSEYYVYALSSNEFGILNDNIVSITGRPPVSFAEFASGAAAAWR